MSAYRDRVAIITGGASGIGAAVAGELAHHGARLVLADRDVERARLTAQAIVDAGGRADAVALDVTDAGAVRDTIERVHREHGRIDFLFNNAGIAIAGEARDHTLDDWLRTLDINLRGVVHGVHAAYPLMAKQGHGHIVNTASVAGLFPATNEIAYTASKYAVVGLTRALRAEGEALGVRATVICPGFVDTPILFENITIRHPGELPIRSRGDLKALLPVRVMPVEKAARIIARGVARNAAIVVVTPHAWGLWLLDRLSPRIGHRLARLMVEEHRRRFPRT